VFTKTGIQLECRIITFLSIFELSPEQKYKVLFSQAAVPAACRILMVRFRHPTANTACTNAAAAALSRPQKVTVMLPDCLLLGSVIKLC
jgi:hypothetical protein